MTRTALLITAFVLLLAAVAALTWTRVIDLPSLSGGGTAFDANETSEAARLVNKMSAAAAAGGFAASFVEQDIKKWNLAGGHKMERFSLGGEDIAYARLSSSVALSPQFTSWRDLGLSMSMPASFSERNKAYAVEVGVVARKPAQNGSDEISIVFATQQTGNSGWNKFKLTQEFQLFTFRWTIPQFEGAYSQDPIVVVHADTEGRGRSVEILGVYVKPSH